MENAIYLLEERIHFAVRQLSRAQSPERIEFWKQRINDLEKELHDLQHFKDPPSPE